MKITKEQIREAYNDVSKLKEWFPSVFEEELEVGKWYWRYGELLVWNNGNNTYGFLVNKDYSDDMLCSLIKNPIKATHREIETALINEAKRRYSNNVLIKSLYYNEIANIGCSFQYYNDNDLWSNGLKLFHNGTWATILPKQMTKEQI